MLGITGECVGQQTKVFLLKSQWSLHISLWISDEVEQFLWKMQSVCSLFVLYFLCSSHPAYWQSAWLKSSSLEYKQILFFFFFYFHANAIFSLGAGAEKQRLRKVCKQILSVFRQNDKGVFSGCFKVWKNSSDMSVSSSNVVQELMTNQRKLLKTKKTSEHFS